MTDTTDEHIEYLRHSPLTWKGSEDICERFRDLFAKITELETDKRDCEECSGLPQKIVDELVALSLSRKKKLDEQESGK